MISRKEWIAQRAEKHRDTLDEFREKPSWETALTWAKADAVTLENLDAAPWSTPDLPALVAEVERLRKVEAAARELIAAEAPCQNQVFSGTESMRLVKAGLGLRAALDAAQGGG